MSIARATILILLSALLLEVRGAHASGGTLRLKTDGVADGYYYNAGGLDAARFITVYGSTEFDLSSVICGTRRQDLNSGQPPLGNLSVELRSPDPNAPGYADLTSAGLLAVADPATTITCSTTAAPTTATFGGGAGVGHPGSDVILAATQPANGPGNLDFCGLLLDTNSIFTGAARSQSLAPGGFRETLGFNHFLELIVFDPSLQQIGLRLSGSSRFPGDPGIPVLFARRRCDPTSSGCRTAAGPGGGVTDDFLTATVVVDNSTPAAAELDLAVEVDRSFFDPKLEPKDLLPRFRPVGGGPPVTNPVSFPPGRTTLRLEFPIAHRQRFVSFFPVNLDFEARLQDPNDPLVVAARTTNRIGISPGVGFYDDDDVTSGGFFATRFPVVTGDALEVRFDALDAPDIGIPFQISGLEVVGGEIGASGLPGLPAITLRTEDPILSNVPDLTPEGLLHDTGPVGFGPPATTVTVDFTDIILSPPNASLARSLWISAFLNPGDTVDSVTAIAGDGPSSPIVGNSFFALDTQVPRQRELSTDWMLRLVTDNAPLASLTGEPRRRTKPVTPRVREIGKYIPLGRWGERIEE